jgi:hypothetical protein
MAHIEDLTGRRFGRLTVAERAPTPAGKPTRWTCVCDCGATITTLAISLKNQDTKSCGCWRIERATLAGLSRRRKLSNLRRYNAQTGVDPAFDEVA